MKVEYNTNIEQVTENVLIVLEPHFVVRTKELKEDVYKVTDVKTQKLLYIKKGTKVLVLSSMWQPENKKGKNRFKTL